jgi:hypothetical protein
MAMRPYLMRIASAGVRLRRSLGPLGGVYVVVPLDCRCDREISNYPVGKLKTIICPAGCQLPAREPSPLPLS